MAHGLTTASGAVRRTKRYGMSVQIAGSLRLDAGGLDHLAPFLGFLGDELAKIGGRARKHRAAQVSKPRFEPGIGKASVDLLVELLDDVSRRALGRTDAEPAARLAAGHKFPDTRNIGQRLRTSRGGHCEVAQLAPPPGRFSMTNGWPRRSDSHCPIRRAMVSAPPAGANGTIR